MRNIPGLKRSNKQVHTEPSDSEFALDKINDEESVKTLDALESTGTASTASDDMQQVNDSNAVYVKTLASGRFGYNSDHEVSIEEERRLEESAGNLTVQDTVDPVGRGGKLTLLNGESISGFPLMAMMRKKKKFEDLAVPGKCLEHSEFDFSNHDQLAFMEAGGALFSFTCRTGLTEFEKGMVGVIANLSSFKDETKDNYVGLPHIVLDDPRNEEWKSYVYVLQKSAYILPGATIEMLTDEFLSCPTYHEQCQPKGTNIWRDVKAEKTFRMTKPVIPIVWSITIQFKVSQITDKDAIAALSKHIGIPVHHAMLMERTKRRKNQSPDATAKAKSVLLYTQIPGGLLMTLATVIMNSRIPRVAAKIVHTFGSLGLKEACETCQRTRAHMLKCVDKMQGK